ncbi:MAG: hypothetical protein O3B01_24800 [Planctomycetota bacterium]|nr:hypothetical protein [Planctomycetota bacterium]MDA1141796.1 hypothetical protein [Planctomycetota bacterium]
MILIADNDSDNTGAITDGGGKIVATSLKLQAGSGVGTSSNPIDTQAGALAASTSTSG